MMDALERVVRSAYDLGALGASADGARLYTARGWQQWRGQSAVMSPDGIRSTAEMDGAIYILQVSVPLDTSHPLVCDWRDGSFW
jgi:aminoglycoside 2'-N-acetyltransferase I